MKDLEVQMKDMEENMMVRQLEIDSMTGRLDDLERIILPKAQPTDSDFKDTKGSQVPVHSPYINARRSSPTKLIFTDYIPKK